MKTNPFRQFSAENIPAVDRYIKKYYAAKKKAAADSLLKDIYSDIPEYLLREGKRIRPLLLMLAAEGYSGGSISRDEILPLAASLEVMHGFLLVQDDIIDRSPLRRGGKAMHITAAEKYCAGTTGLTAGADTASIIADIIFTNALDMTASAKMNEGAKDRFLAMFAKTYEMTAFGQILDILKSSPAFLSEGDRSALKISTHKTAYYTVHYPLAMGAAAAGTDSAEEIKRIEAFAIPLGLAFQIRDDLLGVLGDPALTGKPADSDIREGKLTLLIQNSYDMLPPADRDRFEALFTKKKRTASDASGIRKMIIQSGAVENTAGEWRRNTAKALEAVSRLSLPDKQKKILEAFADSITDKKGLPV
jgi:geranylgeranyl diphosphate synthase type I